MLRDVFYYGKKPNVHPREQFAVNLQDARSKATTRDFWIINEFCDYKNFDWDFDFEFLPDEDVWAEDHNNVWPSQHQKDSGTWLCPKEHSDIIIYRNDVNPVRRKNEKSDNWVELDTINPDKFDFSWHPDPTDPPYIYKWGCKFYPAEIKHVLEYHVPGATQEKYMPTIAELLPQQDLWVEYQEVDKSRFDMSWRPNPLDPPFIYVWGNKYVDGKLKPTLEYHAPNATDKKYMSELIPVLPEQDRWTVIEDVVKDSFDFSWRPDPREPAFIYVFGNEQYDGTIMPTIEYRCPDATEVKYVYDIKAKLAPKKELFEHLEDSYGIDYTWRPDPTSPPYIYAWGNQWNSPEDKISIQYVVDGATEYKYMTERAIRKPCMDNWVIPEDVNTTGFDFSWEPSPAAPAYIYEFATQWQKTGGPQYVVPGATEKQYVNFQKVTKLPSNEGWSIPSNIDSSGFDFSWHPDATSPPYIYVFATQWAFSGGPVYTVDGATEVKYVEDQVAVAKKDMSNWVYDATEIDVDSFDFSWHPYTEDQPYIYQFGTQWQKTGGPRYITPGADSSSPIKYIDTRIIKAKRLPDQDNIFWNTLYPVKEFDFSWHPDDTEEPYIYVFGNNLYPAEECATVEYHVPGATEKKYIRDIHAILDTDMTNWVVPDNIDTSGFDFSWVPNPNDPAYIYEFGTQWQKTGGPKYVVPGATEIKYVDFQKATMLSNTTGWEIPTYVDVSNFDFSWHPDDTDPAYIYQFGTQWALTGGPVYKVEGATEIKYMDVLTAKALPDKTNWVYDATEIDVSSFDFSWHPYIEDQPYIYQFGTQHQKTGGPKYITPGADSSSPIKYIDPRILRATRLPDKDNINWYTLFEVSDFDYSWHPDDTEEPYIYVFGNEQYNAEDMPTVEYRVPGATQIKYVHDICAKLAPNRDNWKIYTAIDESSFDFSWRPHPKDPPYIYRWGNKYVSNKYEATVEYIVPGASDIKYMEDNVIVLPESDRWFIPKGIDISEFDLSWRPDPLEPAQIYQFGTQWQKTNGPVYTYPGATTVKYVDDQKAKYLPSQKNWDIPDNVDVSDFDFSWHPDDTSPPYIYQFPTQWALSGGPRYVVPGATEVKYVETDKPAQVLPNKTNWEYDPTEIDVDSFDFSWHPYAEDQPYIYQFGTQHQKTGGPRYIAPGATSNSPVKYVDTRIIKATRLPNKSNWKALNNLIVEDFDYSWHPDDTESPYVYVFGNTQYPAEEMPTMQYTVDDATEIKYVNDVAAKLGKNMKNWEVPSNVDTTQFDFGWVPHPKAPPYIYEFATEWNNRGGPRYVVKGATQFKYVEDIKAKLLSSKDNWEVDDNVDVKLFDFSWVPHPEAPAYIYQFGTIIDKNDGPRYVTPDNNGEIVYLERVELEDTDELPVYRYFIETTLDDLINEHPDEMFWAMRKNINYDDFDFAWRPNIEQAQYVHVFGSADSEITQTYLVSAPEWLKGNRDLNWVENVELTEESLVEIFIKPDMFYVDRGNSESLARFEALKNKFGDKIQKTRYLNSWVETISRCSNRATSDVFWVLNSELDYSEFNFDYYPNPWQMKMVHVFGTQWSHWGTTFMVNRESFREDTKYIKIIEHLSNLNFVKDIRAKATKCVHDIVVVDHGNKETQSVVDLLQNNAPDRTVTVVKYDTGYLETLKEVIKRQQEKKEHFIWVCSSVCDYTNFDFTYICDPFARDNLHVFPSGKQKFGDTFFIDVNNAREVIAELDALEDFNKVNYNAAIKADRLPEPVIVISDDTHTTAIDKITDFPYATLITADNIDVPAVDVEPMNLWSNETKNIYVTSTGATRIVAPKEIKDHVTKELYEYPYIKRAPKLALSKPLDIVFLSNGEAGAEENWEHLLNITKNLPNRVVRVDGINGRAKAYHAAAEASETPWMFTVFAKLKVSPKFDFNWQPDRMQSPKHYIFHAKNPVNGLIYGHQAMIAYNKKLTLGNEGRGLDFTLDDEHEVVPLISGIAQFNTDEFSTWRTAFREVLKLKADHSEVSKERLDAWLNKAEGDFSHYSIKGATDAEEYYDEVDGDFDKLKLSYEWAWLRDRFDKM